MASTVIKFPAQDTPTSVTLESVGDSDTGTPAVAYAPTKIAERYYQITITEALAGNWRLHAVDGSSVTKVVATIFDLADEETTYYLDDAGGASTTQIWNAARRTLTQSNPANQDLGLSSRLNVQGGYNWVIPETLGDLGTWTHLFFTVKESPEDEDDSAAKIQIKLTNGGDAGDGLVVLNGSSPADATLGSIVVNDAATGEITITVKAGATVNIDPNEGRFYHWDVKKCEAAGDAPYLGNGGTIVVSKAPTRTC